MKTKTNKEETNIFNTAKIKLTQQIEPIYTFHYNSKLNSYNYLIQRCKMDAQSLKQDPKLC